VAVVDARRAAALSFERDTLARRVVFGAGRLARLEGELESLGISRALLITSGSRPALRDRVLAHGGARIGSIFEEVRQHVPVELVERAAAVLGHADGLLCAGGGSAIGLGKALALRSGLSMVAVPTTYSGSEMTPVWGMSQDGEKRTGRDPAVLPRVVLYDPELFTDLPPSIEAASALNAFAHCADALFSPALDPITRIVAMDGARRISSALAPGRVEGRLARCTSLAVGAYLGGAAFAAVGGSIHHSLCHLLGGRYGLPHAETHAAVLPYVLAATGWSTPAALADLAEALGVSSRDVAGVCFDQVGAAGCAVRLRDLGLPHDAALDAGRLFAAHNELIDEEGAVALLEAAWRGERPAPLGERA
jgi:maleylacetate reductase